MHERSDFIGGMGVIENDFHDRKDLMPNVCAVYTEEAYRGRGITVNRAKVLAACIKEAVKCPKQREAQHAPRQGVKSASLFSQPLEQAHACDRIKQM